MKKRLISLGLALTLVLSIIPLGSFNAFAIVKPKIITDGNCHVVNASYETVTEAVPGETLCVVLNDTVTQGKYSKNEFSVNNGAVQLDGYNNFTMPSGDANVSAILYDKTEYTVDLSSGVAILPEMLFEYLSDAIPSVGISEGVKAFDFNKDDVGDAVIDIANHKLSLTDTAKQTQFYDFSINFNDALIEYGKVTFKFAVLPTHTINFVNGDGFVIQTLTNCPMGYLPAYEGATPTKAETEQYRYEFTGWSPTIVPVTKDETYYAQFKAIEKDPDSQDSQPSPATIRIPKKPSTNLTSSDSTDIKLTLKKVKIKKSAKKIVLRAKLQVKGKAVKGEVIVFKFNGKRYTAKTNKKGIAKITIKRKVIKKLRVGKSVKYSATYDKKTVKNKAKVSK